MKEELASEIERTNPYEKIQQFYDKLRYLSVVLKATTPTAQYDAQTESLVDDDGPGIFDSYIFRSWVPVKIRRGVRKSLPFRNLISKYLESGTTSPNSTTRTSKRPGGSVSSSTSSYWAPTKFSPCNLSSA